MKSCKLCGASGDGPTCSKCGEASWSTTGAKPAQDAAQRVEPAPVAPEAADSEEPAMEPQDDVKPAQGRKGRR